MLALDGLGMSEGPVGRACSLQLRRKSPAGAGPLERGNVTDQKAQMIAQLHRIEGQIRGLARMVEEDRECHDVLGQLLAARNSLHRVGVDMVAVYVTQCAGELSPSAKQALEDAVTMLGKMAS